MHITNLIDDQGQRIEIRVTGRIGAENICGIIQHAIVEACCNTFNELVLDLRQAKLETPEQLCRLQSLLEMFKKVVHQKELRITVLFRQGEGEQWGHLSKASKFEGITLRSFINREATVHFLGRETHLLSTVQKKADALEKQGTLACRFEATTETSFSQQTAGMTIRAPLFLVFAMPGYSFLGLRVGQNQSTRVKPFSVITWRTASFSSVPS